MSAFRRGRSPEGGASREPKSLRLIADDRGEEPSAAQPRDLGLLAPSASLTNALVPRGRGILRASTDLMTTGFPSADTAFARPLRRGVRRVMERVGLIGPYYRWLESRIARQPGEKIEDGRPMPPRELLVAVAGTAGERWFSERGQADARRFIAAAATHGLHVDGPLSVLDFGCGSGRIARWLAPDVMARGGAFHGSDLNPTLVKWCADNLPGTYASNELRPPLAASDATYDLVYGHSVVTHLSEKVAFSWLQELARVLRPGGLALLTFHDETYAAHWGPTEVSDALRHRPYVVWNNALEGSNYLSAWTTRDYFARLAGKVFEVLETRSGSEVEPEQALAVLQRR